MFNDCPKDEQFFKESAEYTIKKWTARSNPWGLLVVFTFRGEETCGWSMVAFKLSETDLIMEDEQSQRAFEWLCFTILAYISRCFVYDCHPPLQHSFGLNSATN